MLNEEVINRAEYKEFCHRMEDANERTNSRLKVLEETVNKTNSLVVSVEKLALSVKQLAAEQAEQNKKLDKLESRDGEMWKKMVSYTITAIVGIFIGFIFKQLGM